jgi:hypothetical protein
MFERNWYFQWQKTEYRCVIDLKDPALEWKTPVELGRLRLSRGSGGLFVLLPSGESILLKQGQVYIPGFIISMTNVEGDKYIHVAWSTEGRQYESTTSAHHWYAVWLKPYSHLSRKHIARMNRFVRRTVGRSYAETWVQSPMRQEKVRP